MHQYELMALLARLADVVADVAAGIPGSADKALLLSVEIGRAAREWRAEADEYIEAVTRRADD